MERPFGAYLITLVLLLAVTSLLQAERNGLSPLRPDASSAHAAVLNNFVLELLHKDRLPERDYQEFRFVNPYTGWIFISSRARVSGGSSVRLRLDSDVIITHNSRSGRQLEAMRRLSKGVHVLKIAKTGGSSVESIVVRAIPELIYGDYPQNPFVTESGLYDWHFLEKHVLKNVNCIVAVQTIAEPYKSRLEEWKRQGKIWLFHSFVPGLDRPAVSAEESFDYWSKHPGVTNPLVGGIIVDEFTSPGGNDPRFDSWSAAIDRLYSGGGNSDKRFYAFGALGMHRGDTRRPFAENVMDHDGKVVIELYYAEKPLVELDKEFRTVADDLVSWRKVRPDANRGIVLGLGYMSAPTESLDVNPCLDFKVLMDEEMKTLANDPAFLGLYGVHFYKSAYADEETVRWGSRLFRHYCIEGKKNLLSDELGFAYDLHHLRNPDFQDGLTGWEVSPAEPGSIVAGELKGFGWLQGRYGCPREKGEACLLMRRSPLKPNTVSQQITGLVPGRYYSLKMFSADRREIAEGISNKQVHALKIIIDNVDYLPEKCITQCIDNNYSHSFGKFDASHKAWMNYHVRVFEARGTSATLAISDWNSEESPGGPEGQELGINFIEVQPYFLE